jgi:glycosyltransferase involved in cell wall biosynthesis
MLRGIDLGVFSPENRSRSDNDFVIGFVGRLSPEKSAHVLIDVERELIAAGLKDYRFLVVGDGSQRALLRANLKRAELPGTLRGAQLARAYADMDAFLFPSVTDTFGNVVVEALASGVPAIVSKGGGPKYIIEPEKSGFIGGTPEQYAAAILRLYRDRERLAQMRTAARERALQFSWPAVFEGVYQQYRAAGLGA